MKVRTRGKVRGMTIELPQNPFTLAQARSLGISRRRIDAGLSDRSLTRLLRGVYVRDGVHLDAAGRARAAALATSPHSVICDRTAAWIWGIDSFAYRELDAEPPLETCTLRGHRATRRPEVRGRSRDLRQRDWVEVGGVRVTTPLRTALDLACSLRRSTALAVLDRFMRDHGITLLQMQRELPRYFRRRGVIQLRELVSLADPRAESEGESWTRLEILDHGLPAPQLQYWIVIGGVPTYRLDMAYPRAKIAIEYNGAEYHSSEQDKAADEARRQWLEDHGWTVIVVDKDSFSDEALALWITELREALALAQTPPRRWYVRS